MLILSVNTSGFLRQLFFVEPFDAVGEAGSSFSITALEGVGFASLSRQFLFISVFDVNDFGEFAEGGYRAATPSLPKGLMTLANSGPQFLTGKQRPSLSLAHFCRNAILGACRSAPERRLSGSYRARRAGYSSKRSSRRVSPATAPQYAAPRLERLPQACSMDWSKAASDKSARLHSKTK